MAATDAGAVAGRRAVAAEPQKARWCWSDALDARRGAADPTVGAARSTRRCAGLHMLVTLISRLRATRYRQLATSPGSAASAPSAPSVSHCTCTPLWRAKAWAVSPARPPAPASSRINGRRSLTMRRVAAMALSAIAASSVVCRDSAAERVCRATPAIIVEPKRGHRLRSRVHRVARESWNRGSSTTLVRGTACRTSTVKMQRCHHPLIRRPGRA